MTKEQKLVKAAQQLGEDEVLGPDPSGDNILIAAAELAGIKPEQMDLSKVSRFWRDEITETYFASYPL